MSAAAAAPPAPGSAGAPDQGGPLSALTAAFPVFVLAAAALGLRSPASYAWFDAGAITPVLGATMLGMGLTLKLEVRSGSTLVPPECMGMGALAAVGSPPDVRTRTPPLPADSFGPARLPSKVHLLVLP